MSSSLIGRTAAAKRAFFAAVVISVLVLSSASIWGWWRGYRIARHDHSSPSAFWARGLVVSNRWGERRLEIVYWSTTGSYGLAFFRVGEVSLVWLGLGIYPAREP